MRRAALAIVLVAAPGCVFLDDFGAFEFARQDAGPGGADGSLDAGRDAGRDAPGGEDGGPGPDVGERDSGLDAACGECLVPGEGSCEPATDGTACTAGLCRAGACCAGCWDGMECRRGDTLTACGLGGVACAECTCTGDACTDGACVPALAATEVSTGQAHTCAVAADSTLFCWGIDGSGQLGNGAGTLPRDLPDPVTTPAATGWTAVSAGGRHTCGLRMDGTLHCAGDNGHLQLGSAPTAGAVVSPRPVTSTETWMQVVTGDAFTCALSTTGALWCWGQNNLAQLGLGRTDATDGQPPEVVGVMSTTAIAAGDQHACAVAADGTLRCWGHTDNGQVGTGAMGWGASITAPEVVTGPAAWAGAAGGTSHGCGIALDDDALWCWGLNSAGQLGLGPDEVGMTPHTTPVLVPGSEHWRAVRAGLAHTCAIDETGGAWCWGEGAIGRLGHGAVASVYLPQRIDVPLRWAGIDTGAVHTCGWTVTGAIYCWGQGLWGRLGTGRSTDELSPARVCLP